MSDSAPAGVLLNFIASNVAALFLGVTGGDLALATAGALAMIEDYRARGSADLVAVGQIVTHGLASIVAARQASEFGSDTRLALAFQRNMVALTRSAGRIARPPYTDDTKTEATRPLGPADDPAGDADLFMSVEAASMLAAEAEARLRRPATMGAAARDLDAGDLDAAGLDAVELDAMDRDMIDADLTEADPANPVPVAAAILPALAAPPALGRPPVKPAPATMGPRTGMRQTPARDPIGEALWAITMAREAKLMADGIETLPPHQRADTRAWAKVLSQAANDILRA